MHNQIQIYAPSTYSAKSVMISCHKLSSGPCDLYLHHAAEVRGAVHELHQVLHVIGDVRGVWVHLLELLLIERDDGCTEAWKGRQSIMLTLSAHCWRLSLA